MSGIEIGTTMDMSMSMSMSSHRILLFPQRQICLIQHSHLLMGLRHGNGSGIGILERVGAVGQRTVGFGQVIHDLVVKQVARSHLRRVIVQTSWSGQYSVPRHLSMIVEGWMG